MYVASDSVFECDHIEVDQPAHEVFPGSIFQSQRYPRHTSILEGINNKIKALKRVAYGFRDEAYFS